MTRQNAQRLGRRLKLRDLQILSSVVEHASMARAAARLSMSQPSVSAAIARLESLLGVRLLDRSTQGVTPTAYAEALLKRSLVVFDELARAMEELEFLSNPAQGEVHIACGDTLAAGLVPAAIAQLALRHPGIAVHVVQARAGSAAFGELRDRKVDLVLARTSGKLAESDLDAEMLFEDPHRVVVGASSPWARRRAVDLAQLVEEPWMFPSGGVIRQLIADAFAARGLRMPRESVNASSILLRNRLLATGRFITVLPASVLRYNARQWSLKALPIDLRVTPGSVAMVRLRNRTPSQVAELFAQGIRAVARTMAA